MNLPVNYRNTHYRIRKLVREEYIIQQNGVCWHCGHNLIGEPSEEVKSKTINWRLFPPNFTKYPIHLHHSHDTGMTIGAIHSLCNAVLWQYYGE